MKKPPTPNKRERDRMLVEHNLPQFLKSIERIRKAAHKLDCALSEAKLFAEILAPHVKKGARK
jgi:hypothetical protein